MTNSRQAKVVFIFLVLICVAAGGQPLWAGAPSGPLAGFATSRTWKDRTGRFEIEAKLSYASDKEVQLKKADGRVITVPLEKLSDADQGYIQGFLAAEKAIGGGETDNPFAGGEPKDEMPSAEPDGKKTRHGRITFPKREARVNGCTPITIDVASEFWEAGPVTALETKRVRDMALQLPMQKEFWAATQMRIAGAPPNLLIDLYRQGNKPEENYSYLGRVILPRGKPKTLAQAGDPWKLLALSADAQMGAVVRVVGFDKGNDVGIFQLTEDALSPLCEFTAGEGAFGELQWAGFLGDNRLATISQKHTLTVWDLSTARALFRGTIEGAASASIGGNAELLAVSHNRGVVVLECKDFKQVGFLPLASPTSSVAFSPDGQRLAATAPFEVLVYDLKDGKRSASIAVPDSHGELDWVGDHVLLNKTLLIDVAKQMPAWTYAAHATAQVVYGSQLFTLFANERVSSVVAITLPHKAAERAIKEINPADLYALQKGSPFTISAALGGLADKQDEILRAVRQKLEAHGWKHVESAPNQVTIELTQGEQQETEYRTFGFHTEKVAYRPWVHTIKFTVGGEEVYRYQQSTGGGYMLSLKQGESAQQGMDRLAQPSATIFTGAVLPGRVLKPKFRRGLGASTIGENGMR